MIEMTYDETPDPHQAERNLWSAVMMEAFESLGAGSPKQRREAHEWFESRNQGVGSFVFVCTTLGIAPLDVRRRLSEWKQNRY